MSGFGSQNGGSLFGQQNTSQQGGGLFSSTPTNNAFGSGTPTQPSLGASQSPFGAGAAKRSQSVGGLFGSASTPSSSMPNQIGSSNSAQGSGSTGLFGTSSTNSAAPSSLFGGSSTTSNSGSGGGLFGASKPTGNLLGASTTPPSTGLFGQSNQATGQTGSLFGNNATNQSGTPFGQTNQQNTTTGSTLFGKPAEAGSSLFGSKPSQAGGLFGGQSQNSTQSQLQQPQGQPSLGPNLFSGNTASTPGTQPNNAPFGNTGPSSTPANPATGLFGGGNNTGGGMFGSASSNNAGAGLGKPVGGGLFGNSNLNSSSSTNGNSTGGLFGGNNTSGGLFGNKAGTSGLFGSAGTQHPQPQQQQQQPQQQPLIATIDQASYILQGVSPSQKLYTSLTQPALKRGAHEAYKYKSYGASDTFKEVSGEFEKPSSLHKSALNSTSGSVATPLLVADSNSRSVTSGSRGEPRQWVNSYEKFLKERPTTLVIKRDGKRPIALPSPPVSTAPPPVASVPTGPSVSQATRDSTFMSEKTSAPVEPDVSLFHRQANNMTVVQVSKKALEEGYYIYPRLETLSAMSKAQLSVVRNLVVGREKYGQIEYTGTVDLSHIANLGDILGTLVVFEAGTVCVYPDEDSKALPGHELNLPCTVTIENAWPIEASTHKKITDMENPRMRKHIARLWAKCEADGGEFVTFAQGMWVFKVPHFSTWGLPVDEMIVDGDEAVEGDVLPHDEVASTPTFSAQYGANVTAQASAEFEGILSEDSAMIDESVDAIQDWQEQLNHATLSWYTATQESLVAAGALPEELDLEAVLLPTPTRVDQHKTVSEELDNDQKTAQQEMKAAVQSSLRLDALRSHTSKSARDKSLLPLLQTRLGTDDLKKLRPHNNAFWSLLSALYTSNGLDSTMLSQWLEDKVSDITTSASDDLEAIWELVTTHRLPDAVTRSLSSNNPHLAVLISLFEDHNTSVEDAQQQLRYWKEHRTLSSVPAAIRRIWELASGAPPNPSGLSWAQWLGMRFWYSPTIAVEAINKIPAPLLNEGGAELSLIKQAVGSKQLRAVIEELGLVDSFLCLQALDTLSAITTKPDVKCYDTVCSELSRALQETGEPNLAVYVGLHIKDSKRCLDIVHNVLVEASDLVSLSTMQDLGVPDQLLDEARAAHSNSIADFQASAEYLIRAGLFERAHEVVYTKVAPQAVLDRKLAKIEDLLLSLESSKDSLRHWTLGGNIYLEYLRALRAGDTITRYDAKALCNSCRYAITPNLQSQAAISLVAQWAATTHFARTEFGIDTVLNMKLDPSQTRLVALEQASRLLK